jgi:hypothetical protein
MNTIEKTGIKYIIARLKSKSPKGYALLTNLAVSLAAACGLYVYGYSHGLTELLPKYAAVLAQINNLCIVAGAALTAVGLVSKSTTTDPTLLSQELIENVKATVTDAKSFSSN